VDEVEFARQFRPDGPATVDQVLARALATPDRAELEQAAAERAAADALAERRETTAMLNALHGNPLAELSRAQQVAAAARDEVADLEARLAVARERFRSAAESVVDFGTAADEVLNASARRSSPDLLQGAREVLTDYQIRQMAAQRSQAPGRHPKGRGGRAVRSEVTCRECIAAGATAEESWLIHQDPDAAIETEMVGLSEMVVAAWGRPDQAERRTSAGSVISR
jgi:hypothetical protein